MSNEADLDKQFPPQLLDAKSLASAGMSANLENPRPPSSYQSGITVLFGWVCNANRVDIEIDGSLTLQAAYGTWRSDTEPVCGDSNNGFGLLYNMNHLSAGIHSLRALADGVEIGRTDFTVTTLGQDYLRGVTGRYTLPNFPVANQTVDACWEESVQNFVICASSLRREAEDAPSGSGTRIPRSKASGGAVWHVENPGDRVSYAMPIPQAGHYRLVVHYSNDDTGLGDQPCVWVNSAVQDCFNTQNTRPANGALGSGWNVFVDSPAIDLGFIAAGPTTIALELRSTDGFGVDLDLLSVILAP